MGSAVQKPIAYFGNFCFTRKGISMSIGLPSNAGFGPTNDMPLELGDQNVNAKVSHFGCMVIVKPGQTARYIFGFSAEHEQETILYNYPNWDRIAIGRIDNYDFQLPNHEWDFTNTTNHDVWHIITGWHKNTGPDSHQPWYRSPVSIQKISPTTVEVGFADNWYDPPFNNGQVRIVRTNDQVVICKFSSNLQSAF